MTKGAELEQLRERLKEGTAALNFPKGVRALWGLEEEFSKLEPVLEDHWEAARLSIISLPALAGETYHRGLSVLADALELMKAIHGPDRERLEAGIQELKREAGSSWDDESQRVLTLIREDTLASHRQRLAMLPRLDDPAKPHTLVVVRDVLDLVGDRTTVCLAKLGQDLPQRAAFHVHTENVGG